MLHHPADAAGQVYWLPPDQALKDAAAAVSEDATSRYDCAHAGTPAGWIAAYFVAMCLPQACCSASCCFDIEQLQPRNVLNVQCAAIQAAADEPICECRYNVDEGHPDLRAALQDKIETQNGLHGVCLHRIQIRDH